MSLAIIKTGGKQYMVQDRTILDVEKLPAEAQTGGQIIFNEVLLLDDGQTVTVGKPVIPGATVTAEAVAETRGPKVRVVRYKAKTGYHKVYGHRQAYTKVKITSITGASAKPAAKPKKEVKKEAK